MTFTAPLSAELQRRLLDNSQKGDFRRFVRRAFEIVSPGDVYKHNWHVDAMAHHLDLVHAGTITRLIITVPPRSLKSITTSVGLVAFILGQDPTRRIVCISYSDQLATILSSKFRTLINSPWYRRLFPGTRIDSKKDSATEVRTTRGGGRLATSIGGALTGLGADYFIIDDPMKAQDAASETSRERVREWASSTLASRENDPGHGRMIVVMQRLHEDDLAGHYLKKGGWTQLNLPAVAQESQTIATGKDRVHEFRAGELLDPVRLPQSVLDDFKRDLGSDLFQAQYLQQPVPPGGRLFKREWFKYYELRPRLEIGDEFVISWDTASKDGPFTDFSVATVWLIRGQSAYLLDLRRARMEFPELLRCTIELWNSYPAASVLVEDAGSGTQLIQSLRSQRRWPIEIRPLGDKVSRASGQTPKFEAGAVFFPRSAPWLDNFLTELLTFPGKHDDQVDSVVQALSWLQSRQAQYRTVMIGRMGPTRG